MRSLFSSSWRVLAWPLSSRPTAGLTPPRAGPQPARFRRCCSGRSLSPAPPALPLRSPPPVPRPRRRQEPGCDAGRRRGERRGWIQHGGAEPEPGGDPWETKSPAECSEDRSCQAGILGSIAHLSPQHGGAEATSEPGVARRAC